MRPCEDDGFPERDTEDEDAQGRQVVADGPHGYAAGLRGPPGAVARAGSSTRCSRTVVTSSKNRGRARVFSLRGRGRSMSTTRAMRPGRGLSTTTRVERKTASRDAVGHEEHGRTGLAADVQELPVQALACHLVERPERLVHEQDRRVRHEGPGDGDALLHPARELPRVVAAEAVEPDQPAGAPAPAGPARPAAGPPPRAAGGRWPPPCASRRARAPGRRCRSPGRGARPPGDFPFTVTVPADGATRSPTIRRSVDFPQPDGPISETNSPRSTASETSRRASVSPAWLGYVLPTPCERDDRQADPTSPWSRPSSGRQARQRRSTAATAW